MISHVTHFLSHVFDLQGLAVHVTVSILTYDVLLFDSRVWLSASLIGLSPLMGAWLNLNLSLPLTRDKNVFRALKGRSAALKTL